jgi:hypothetical protein
LLRAGGAGGGTLGGLARGALVGLAAGAPVGDAARTAPELDAAGEGARTMPDACWSFVSMILCSSALRSAEPGGGGGTVRGFERPPAGGTGAAGVAFTCAAGVAFAGAAGVAFAGAGVAAAGGGRGSGAAGASGAFTVSDSTVQPDARSAIRAFVSSPSRRRERSSSGTARR